MFTNKYTNYVLLYNFHVNYLLCTNIFKNMYSNLTMSPKPILWLSAVIYYSYNFKKIKNFIFNLDSNAVMAIKKTIEIVESKNLQTN